MHEPTFQKSIVEVEVAGLKLFAFKDDHIVQYLTTSDNLEATTTLAVNAAKMLGSIHYLDIGSNYGLDLLLTTRALLKSETSFRVSGFDPGEAGDLTPHNISINEMSRYIDFRNVAIANISGKLRVYGENKHSENNSIVKLGENSFVIFEKESVSIDDYLLSSQSTMPLFVKIDTQGGEPLVFDGMRETINSDRPILGFTEFAPGPISLTRDPIEFLKELMSFFTMYDVGASRTESPQKIVDASVYIEKLFAISPSWTDILFTRNGDEALLKSFIK